MTTENLNVSKSYLSFKLGDETFAVTVGRVHEILEIPSITKVPKSPDFMRGIINLRGSVLPVIDTRIKFNLGPTEYTVNSSIIVLTVNVDNESIQLGAIMDSVQEVIELEEENILPSPSIGSRYRSEFIKGIANINEQFIMVLNIDEVFSFNELIGIKESFIDNGSSEHN